MFLVYVVLCLIVLVVSTSAIDCLERLVSEMIYYVSSGTLNPTHSLSKMKKTQNEKDEGGIKVENGRGASPLQLCRRHCEVHNERVTETAGVDKNLWQESVKQRKLT